MLTVCRYQVLRFLRDRVLLLWTLGLPVALSLLFTAMFSNLAESYAADPVAFGIVQDSAYDEAEGLDAVILAVSGEDAHPRLIDVTVHASPAEAEAAALRGDTVGYLAVEDGDSVLHVSQQGNASDTIPVLRAVLDSYVRTRAEYTRLAAAGGPTAEQAAALGAQRVLTRETQVTRAPGDPLVRYYFALLAFACGMGTSISMLTVRDVVTTFSALGARHAMAGIPRWRVLAGALTGSWSCILVCLLTAFAFIRLVVGVDFGPRTGLCLVAIGVSSLMSCAAGAALGTVRGARNGVTTGVTCLLSLFTGLYGTAAQQLTDAAEQAVPLLTHANPLWQSAHCFFALLYYDSFEPFAQGCAVLAGMTCLFLAVALARMRRMSHEQL